jgi:hypothetical protein
LKKIIFLSSLKTKIKFSLINNKLKWFQ